MKNQDFAKPNYASWHITADQFPSSERLGDKIRFLSRYGSLAPSVHNTQPWTIEYEEDRMFLAPDSNVALHQADPEGIWQYFSLGAYAENVCQAAEAYGLEAEVVFDSEKLQIRFREGESQNLGLLDAITKRSSVKRPYSMVPLDVEFERRLSELKVEAGVSLIVANQGSSLFDSCVEVHMRAMQITVKNSGFVRELSRWMRANNTRSETGMPGFVVGLPLLPSLILPKVLKVVPGAFAKAENMEQQLIKSSSGLVVVTAENTNPQTMINVGIYTERLWLDIIRAGMVGHPMTAALHNADSSSELAKVLGTQNRPVFLMRIGSVENAQVLHTPRKRV